MKWLDKALLVAFLIIAVFLSFFAQAEVIKGIDDDAKLPYWEWRSEVVSIRLVQRLPDQSRAYFMARNFTAKQAEQIAQSCVFQSVFKNIAKTNQNHIIRYDLSEWHVIYKNKKYDLKLKETWLLEWKKQHVPMSAQIAFEWSLLPSKQQYQKGDYNWGMTMYVLPSGAYFDLQLVWYENAKQMQAVIENMQCALDIHPDPGGED